MELKGTQARKSPTQSRIFLLDIAGEGPASVFTVMQLKQTQTRATRVLAARQSPALAPIISNPNLATPVTAGEIATALRVTQPLVRYFDPYGGFDRVGRIIASRLLSRGKRKGTILLTIAAMPSGQVIRDSSEVELVK